MNDMPERLPSRPLRNWFLAWHIHTGDPANVIARGFDLDPVLVADFLGGDSPLMIGADEALLVCRRLRLDPIRVWEKLLPSGWENEEPEVEVDRLYQLMSGRSTVHGEHLNSADVCC